MDSRDRHFRKLVKDPVFTPGSKAWRLLNEAHHAGAIAITYVEIYDARAELNRARGLVEAAHEEYDRWRRRLPRFNQARVIPLPSVMSAVALHVPVVGRLAAYGGHRTVTEMVDTGAFLNGTWFVNKAVYYLNCDNFGFSAKKGYRVIVSLDEGEITTNRLVIALREKGEPLARRLIRDERDRSRVVLVEEGTDPRNRDRAFACPSSDVRLLKVVGVLFDRDPFRGEGKPRGEACPEGGSPLLKKVEAVFQVELDSALPLALDRQKILCGRDVPISELQRMKDKIVAVWTKDGSSYLKRVGDSVPRLPQLCLLESIGGLGESLLLRLAGDETPELSGIPVLHQVREVLGVLYHRGDGSLGTERDEQ